MNVPSIVAALSAIILFARPALPQCQTQKLVASDAAANDRMGNALAVSGNWMIVGAEANDDLGLAAGTAYVFQRQGSTWVQTQKLHASDAASGASFGWSASISGGVLVVGAPGHEPQSAGAAYVFERIGTIWTETALLLASDKAPTDQFGQSVSVSGDRIIVGAPSSNAPLFISGSAYIYEKTAGVWGEVVKLTASDAAASDGLGFSVAIEGDTAVVGNLGDEGPAGQNNTGSAYVFQEIGGTWFEIQKLTPSTPQISQIFGVSASISGSTIIVGAMSDDTAAINAGAAYVYENQGGSWTEVQKLTATDSNNGNACGFSVTVVGDWILMGCLGDGDVGTASGSAYAFRHINSTWVQIGKALARDGVAGDLLGYGVALDGDTALVSATRTDGACPGQPDCDSGSVYVFRLAPTAKQYGSCPTGSPCNNTDDHGGCRNSAGQGAVFSACGSGSITQDDLQLEVTRCPPNKLTLLFMGPSQTPAIYADGIRVASPQTPIGIYRFGGAAADAQGRVMRGPGLITQSQGFPVLGRIQSGQSWNFQTWYRDTQGPCQGLTNFSNGVQVAFGP
jgi:hypothetical protein